jgi:hypothetical protein
MGKLLTYHIKEDDMFHHVEVVLPNMSDSKAKIIATKVLNTYLPLSECRSGFHEIFGSWEFGGQEIEPHGWQWQDSDSTMESEYIRQLKTLPKDYLLSHAVIVEYKHHHGTPNGPKTWDISTLLISHIWNGILWQKAAFSGNIFDTVHYHNERSESNITDDWISVTATCQD